MPHLTLEYSANLDGFDALQTLRVLNRMLADTGEFNELDIKSRAVALDQFIVGTQEEQRGFIHARLSILSGRPADTKSRLSAALLQGLRQACTAPAGVSVQLCAEILDIDRDSYAKSVLQANN